jgi:DNA-binding transcriptional ArsR family regulator
MSPLRQREKIDETLAAVVAHSTRVRAFVILAERTASPVEIAQQINKDVGHVGYHVRKLQEMELIELVDERPVRGAVEHFYRAIERPMLSAEQYALLDQGERNTFARNICQLFFTDVAAAIASEKFSSRPDNMVARAPMLVDEEGWKELSALYDETLAKTLEVQAHSAERMSRSKEEGVHVEGGLFLFEREMNP